MTERTVRLTADEGLRLTPHDVPCGVQGEHRASAVEILLPTAADGYTLQIEAVDGLGRARESGPLLPQQTDEGSMIRFDPGAGLLNCWGMIAPGISFRSSSALAIAPFMPCGPGVSSSSAPMSASILRRSSDMVSGMTRMRR